LIFDLHCKVDLLFIIELGLQKLLSIKVDLFEPCLQLAYNSEPSTERLLQVFKKGPVGIF
jgi:hypothetical protein